MRSDDDAAEAVRHVLCAIEALDGAHKDDILVHQECIGCVMQAGYYVDRVFPTEFNFSCRIRIEDAVGSLSAWLETLLSLTAEARDTELW